MSTQPEPTVPELTLGWRLRMSLAFAGLTPQEIADAMEMNRSTISNWLNDHYRPPKTWYLREWARLTGVDYDWLVTGERPPPPKGPVGAGRPKKEADQPKPQSRSMPELLANAA